LAIFEFVPNSGWNPTWMWSAWSGIEYVLSAPSNSIREMICAGSIVPWRVSRRWIAISVIEPLPWWPMIGMPLIAAMSTALPLEWCDTLPDAV
jgi:hypothetical protein